MAIKKEQDFFESWQHNLTTLVFGTLIILIQICFFLFINVHFAPDVKISHVVPGSTEWNQDFTQASFKTVSIKGDTIICFYKDLSPLNKWIKVADLQRMTTRRQFSDWYTILFWGSWVSKEKKQFKVNFWSYKKK